MLLAVPVGVFGALALAKLFGQSNDVYFKVGLLTTIGLTTKNAILIVEFAKDMMERGSTAVEAVIEAARLRLRPIAMTSLAFVLGVMPLARATGDGRRLGGTECHRHRRHGRHDLGHASRRVLRTVAVRDHPPHYRQPTGTARNRPRRSVMPRFGGGGWRHPAGRIPGRPGHDLHMACTKAMCRRHIVPAIDRKRENQL